MRHAAKTYASTLAMLQLDTILRYSVKYGKPKQPKKGVKNQEIFTQMQEMHCELVGIGEVKMMVGIKRSGEKIQYCITAITAYKKRNRQAGSLGRSSPNCGRLNWTVPLLISDCKSTTIFRTGKFFFISPIYFCIFAADFGRKSSKRYACFCM